MNNIAPMAQYEYATVTSKGQLVIPVKLRRKFGIRNGSRIAIREEQGRIILHPMTRAELVALCGSMSGGPSMMKMLKRERKREK